MEKGTQIDVTGNAFITKPDLKYSTHIQNIGWEKHVSNNSISGTTGQGLRLEAIKTARSSLQVLSAQRQIHRHAL